MLFKVSALNGLPIEARDGQVGSVHDVLFEDDSWKVRWIVVDTGSWLAGRRVLLPASHLGRIDRDVAALPVDLTTSQIEESPGAETDLPVSRQVEAALYSHYGWTPYWPVGPGTVYPPPLAGGAGAWRAGAGVPRATRAPLPGPEETGDPHLRSAREVTGYYIAGRDDDIGHVEELLLDGDEWAIRSIVVDTRNWWPGKKVMVPREAVEEIIWPERTIRLGRTRREIQDAPEYAAA